MIPYATAADAEAALGRAMTGPEAAWFRYSAAVPDHWLLWHNVVILFLVHAAAPVPLALFERLAPAVASRYQLQPRARLPPALVGRYFRDTVLVFMQVVGPYSLISYPIVKLSGVWMGPRLPSAGEIVAQLLVYTLVEDYLSYWIHRLLHTKWGYENIHHVHHEVTTPTGFATSYSHWAEVCIFAVPTYAGPCIVPCHVTVHWLWLTIRTLEAIHTHAGYDFPYSPTKLIPFFGGAEFHDYHHETGRQCKSNFGSILTYCDYIYGTDKGYRYRKARLDKMKTKVTVNEDCNAFIQGKLA